MISKANKEADKTINEVKILENEQLPMIAMTGKKSVFIT